MGISAGLVLSPSVGVFSRAMYRWVITTAVRFSQNPFGDFYSSRCCSICLAVVWDDDFMDKSLVACERLEQGRAVRIMQHYRLPSNPGKHVARSV